MQNNHLKMSKLERNYVMFILCLTCFFFLSIHVCTYKHGKHKITTKKPNMKLKEDSAHNIELDEIDDEIEAIV